MRPSPSPRILLALLALSPACGGSADPVAESRSEGRQARPTLIVTSSLVFRGGEEALIEGRLSNLPVGGESGYQVLVQGLPVTAGARGPGQYEWSVNIPLDGPPGSEYFPYAAFYAAFNRVAMPLLIEVVERPANTVVLRRKYRLYDLRRDPELELAKNADHSEVLGGQLTDRGLDRLERTHLATLPPPDLGSFNDLLAALYTQPVRELGGLPNSILNSDRTCFPLDDLEELFAGTPAVFTVKLMAGLQQGIYNSLASTGVGAAALQPFCVQGEDDIADNSNYEVCVGALRGSLDHAEVLAASYVNLEPGGDVQSTVLLGGIDQIVDVELTEVTVRWAKRPTCGLRDALTIPIADETLAATPERAAWSRCEDANARALEASSSTYQSSIVLGRAPDLMAVEGSVVTFEIDAAARQVRELSSHCATPLFRPFARELLASYYPDLEQALGVAWSTALPNSEYARALDALLHPFEHGAFDVGLDHDLQSPTTDRGALPGVDGLGFRYAANAQVRAAFALTPAPETFVCPRPYDLVLSEDGRSEHLVRVPFDVSFSTTTCALNQVLREEHATARVNFTLTPSVGAALSAALASVDPTALAALTSTSVTWHLSPTLPAWTWMGPHNAPEEINPEQPIAYHNYDLALDAYAAGERLLSLRLDFLDPAFRLTLNPTLGATVAVPLLGGRLFAVTVVNTELSLCPMAPHDLTGAESCERDLETLAREILQPGMEAIMRDLLSDYPVPMFFDAEGRSAEAVQALGISPVQRGNRITWYAVLPPAGELPEP